MKTRMYSEEAQLRRDASLMLRQKRERIRELESMKDAFDGLIQVDHFYGTDVKCVASGLSRFVRPKRLRGNSEIPDPNGPILSYKDRLASALGAPNHIADPDLRFSSDREDMRRHLEERGLDSSFVGSL
jgi:hypothetical protein